MQKILVSGKLLQVASRNPLQTNLKLILTDFAPNANKVGIPKDEAQNVIATAMFQPFKINFNGVSAGGHKGAVPVGTIVHAELSEDEGNEVIVGDVVVWNHEYPEVAEFIKEAHANNAMPGTSWEIFYDEAVAENDVNWLRGCLFGGTCVVDVPAYGPQRTRVLAVAESLNTMTLEEALAQIEQLKASITQLESAATEKDAALNDFKTKLEAIQAEAEAKALAEKKAARKSQLESVGVNFDEKESVYMEMSDETFREVVSALVAVSKKEVAEKKEDPIIPEFPHNRTDLRTLASQLAAELKKK